MGLKGGHGEDQHRHWHLHAGRARAHAGPRAPDGRLSGLADGRARAAFPAQRGEEACGGGHAPAAGARGEDLPRPMPDGSRPRPGIHGGGLASVGHAHHLHDRRLLRGAGPHLHLPQPAARRHHGDLREGDHRGHRPDRHQGGAHQDRDRRPPRVRLRAQAAGRRRARRREVRRAADLAHAGGQLRPRPDRDRHRRGCARAPHPGRPLGRHRRPGVSPQHRRRGLLHRLRPSRHHGDPAGRGARQEHREAGRRRLRRARLRVARFDLRRVARTPGVRPRRGHGPGGPAHHHAGLDADAPLRARHPDDARRRHPRRRDRAHDGRAPGALVPRSRPATPPDTRARSARPSGSEQGVGAPAGSARRGRGTGPSHETTENPARWFRGVAAPTA